MFSKVLARRTTGNVTFSLALVLAVICAAFLLLWLNRTDPDAPLPNGSSPSDPDTVLAERGPDGDGQGARDIQPEPLADKPSPNESSSDLEHVKAQQAQAARAAIDAEPVDGTLSVRPEFVSELEWKVLQDAADQNPEMDQRLTHLVNKLLFFKKRKAWMAAATDAARRRKLARELLAMIPAQVSEQAIDPAFADKLERDLQHYLDSATDNDR
jgi:hypothetical protein